MVSVPLAVAAIGIGIAAQALLRPGPSSGDPDLLDALMAQPKASAPIANRPVAEPAAVPSDPLTPPARSPPNAGRLGRCQSPRMAVP